MRRMRANREDAEKLQSFYKDAIDRYDGMTQYAKWIYGLHPTDEMIEGYIAQGALYYFEDENGVAAAAACTASQDESYHPYAWSAALRDDEVSVLHILCVDPARKRMGLGRALVAEMIKQARKDGKKALRLDALSTNLPAQRLYESMGFVRCGEGSWRVPNIGQASFVLYEMNL